VHVPADAGDAIADVVAKVISGAVDYMMAPISIVAGPLATGELVALGVTTARRSPALPDTPTLDEAGAAGYDFAIWYGAWAAAATPPTLIDRLTSELADTMAQPRVLADLASDGMLPLHMTRDRFRRFVDDEVHRAARIICNTATTALTSEQVSHASTRGLAPRLYERGPTVKSLARSMSDP
jgi:tripartite-type tricarboxylate transporter receptor subunit TctC